MGEASSSSSWPSRGAAAAAAAYDYERDPRWAEYRASSTVPPHLFTDPYVRAHLQHKFYRRFVVRTPLPLPLHSAPQFSRLSAPHFGSGVLPRRPWRRTAGRLRSLGNFRDLARLLSSLLLSRSNRIPFVSSLGHTKRH